jgi:hypothetical protein
MTNEEKEKQATSKNSLILYIGAVLAFRQH